MLDKQIQFALPNASKGV